MARFRQLLAGAGGSNPLSLAVAALLLLLTGFAAGWSVSGPAVEAAGSAPAIDSGQQASQAPRASAPFTQASYADAVARVTPAVVTIRAERVVRTAAPAQSPFPDDLFGQLFGNRGPRRPPMPREERGLGSGVIVSADGYILTNHHVVEGANQVRVELPDRRSFEAKVIGTDAPSDLAVLKIDAANLPTVPMGDSDRVRVGDVALAVGNPLGVGQTVTMGIISAKGRAAGFSDGSFEDFLQTDAPINQGNSGGALVNAQGELVGINSQILTPSGGNIGIGFAIPVSMAKNVMQQLIEGGVVRRAMLGVTVQPMTSDLARSLGISEVRGALVTSVEEGGPAQKAGLQKGDVILEVNGTPVADSNSLRNQIASLEPGARAEVKIQRNGKQDVIRPVLAELPTRRAATDAQGQPGTAQGRYGLSVAPVTPEVARQLGLEKAQGVVVEGVAPGSPASEAGVRAGDVIEQVNNKPVRGVSELQEALKSSGERPALVLLNREGASLFVALSPRNS